MRILAQQLVLGLMLGGLYGLAAAGLSLVFGVLKVLNVAHGGTLEQHLPDAVGHNDHARTPGEFVRHSVRLEPARRLRAARLGRKFSAEAASITRRANSSRTAPPESTRETVAVETPARVATSLMVHALGSDDRDRRRGVLLTFVGHSSMDITASAVSNQLSAFSKTKKGCLVGRSGRQPSASFSNELTARLPRYSFAPNF